MSLIPTNIIDPRTLVFGGGIAYMSSSPIITKAACDTTTFNNLGFIDKDNAAQFEFIRNKLQWKNGTPSKVVYEIPIDEAINFSAQLGEQDVDILSMIFGTPPVHTYAASPLTVLADPVPTASAFTLSAATGLAAGQLVQMDLDPAGDHDYYNRRLLTADGAAVTLHQALPSAPVAADELTVITKTEWELGGSASFQYYGFKWVKLFPIINYELTIFLYKVGVTENVTLAAQDDNKNPAQISLSAQSNPNVESGKFGFARLAPKAA